MTAHPDTLVTAAELQRAWARLLPFRLTGTLRFEAGHVAFEGSDGRRRFRVPVEEVTDVVRDRAGFGLWATFAGRRYFVVPRTRPRPGGYVAAYALLRPITTVRYLWWRLRDRRRGRELTCRWLTVLTRGRPDAAKRRGLHPALRIPIRIAVRACVVLPLPAVAVLAQVG
jgi:hypothetical protein